MAACAFYSAAAAAATAPAPPPAAAAAAGAGARTALREMMRGKGLEAVFNEGRETRRRDERFVMHRDARWSRSHNTTRTQTTKKTRLHKALVA